MPPPPTRPATVTGSRSGFGGGLGPVEREEIAGDARRFAQICAIALPIWAAFFGVDVLLSALVFPGASLGELLVLRVVGVAVIALGALWPGWRPIRSSAGVSLAVALMGFAVTVIIGLLAARLGGLHAPYLIGAAFPLAAFGLMQRRLRASLLPLVGTAAGYPLGLIATSPGVRAALEDGAGAALFATQCVLLFALAGFSAVLSHYGWTLRRALFESRSIGRYQLKKRLGRGGMGEVWSAFHTTLGRDVAVKILRPERTDDAAVARFEREVRATGELAHPHTVRIFDCGVTEDGLWYFAMELLGGVTLARLVEAGGPLPPARAVHFLTQASRALAEAHARGIVHRDVKPDNLFVTHAGGEADFIKVIDFGIAHVAADEVSVTAAGHVAGTPQFMAPEVAEGKRADPRADVYALGATLYYALVGKPPFAAETPAALLLAHVSERVVPPSVRMTQPLDADVEHLVLRCLRKDPVERFADAGQLAGALAACGVAGTWDPRAAPPYPSTGEVTAMLETPPTRATIETTAADQARRKL